MKNLFLTIWTWLTGTSKNLIQTLLPIFQKEGGKFMDALLPTAIIVCRELISSGKLPDEKKNEAVIAVKSAALTAGLNVSTSVLNLIVESAYQIAKAQPTDK